MSISPETTARLLEATKEAAIALSEDITHIREVLKRDNIERGDIRRLSAILRRALIDSGGDITSVAPPRIGRLNLHGPDNGPIYAIDRKTPFQFFGSGSGKDFLLFGSFTRGLGVRMGNYPTAYDGFEPHKLVTLSHDGFLNQKVLCFNGKWVNRRSVIRYVANVASGVHSGAPENETEKVIAAIRNCAQYSPKNGKMHVHLDVNSIITPSTEFIYSAGTIDPVLFELICSAILFVTASDIIHLETTIHEELTINTIFQAFDKKSR